MSAVRSPAGRIAIVVGTAAVLVVLFVVLRSSNDDDAASATTTTTAEQTTTDATNGATTTAPTTTTTTATRPAGPTRIRITVAGGKVRGPRNVRLKKGERVVLVVRADVSDHVHVHGYDLMRNVGPGAPAQIAFRATIVGRFDVELEDRKLPILEFEVRP